MLLKEYRICMPLSVEEYRIGQLYMIAKHSHEQTDNGEGVEIIKNEECNDPIHGVGRYTEKRVHLSNRLPSWIRSLIPKIFYVTEKAWNYYPFTITEYTCSFLPRYSIYIETRYEDNSGISDNCLNLSEDEMEKREVDYIDIVNDPLPPKHYKESEDLTKFKSSKTNRGPLHDNWTEDCAPLMCSYKSVKVKFEVFGLQGKVETFTHKTVRDILLLGHRQAFAWIDEWIDMSMEDLRAYETSTNEATNKKVLSS
ncbi:cytoplasmic phosphatidylinositol transfer protein 1-like [Physella acuta]|uniref:cytoplasmic phosphatidylinositol transfer protein 1-like n=1 Tax=Physella acuta TaxID=109671 RepID=UPI0027DD552C|nr:cytoplasmic phosphatidylinositol transfer protein 1-like [Physella acuta]